MIDIPDEKVINPSRDDSDTPDTTLSYYRRTRSASPH